MSWIEKMNTYGALGIPFLFVIDFEIKMPVVAPLDSLDGNDVFFQVGGIHNYPGNGMLHTLNTCIELEKYPMDYKSYEKAFNYVVKNQNLGYSYLLNLTFPTKITLNCTLKDVFSHSKAKYKLYYKDQFVVFSPEIFVQIENNIISSNPMKGTIDASLPNAEERIKNNEKERAEHATIVDLIRNDLSYVAENVKVDRYRYIEKLRTNNKDLLQVSSKISGSLQSKYKNRLGDIYEKLLPAGSISGAPKAKTVELIKNAEKYTRGYYTGVFGIFDGRKVDSCVMIRYIENSDGNYYYKSGGGITAQSNAKDEYNELMQKIYVPVG